MTPDHGITKGYPYDIIISKERFKNRLGLLLDRSKNNRIQLTVDKATYPSFPGVTWYHRFFTGQLIDFLFFRLFDYAEALTVAENQIEDLLTEGPFIPEDFGFFKAVGPKEISDNPTVIYISRYDENISIFRNTVEEYEWRLVKNENGNFKDTKLTLPSHRIAYAAFFALGIQVETSQTPDIMRTKKDKLKDFTVEYNPINGVGPYTLIVKAYDKQDARSRAKFIFETADFGISVVEFNELEVNDGSEETSSLNKAVTDKLVEKQDKKDASLHKNAAGESHVKVQAEKGIQ